MLSHHIDIYIYTYLFHPLGNFHITLLYKYLNQITDKGKLLMETLLQKEIIFSRVKKFKVEDDYKCPRHTLSTYFMKIFFLFIPNVD